MLEEYRQQLSVTLAAVNFPNDRIRKVPVEGLEGCFILENVLQKDDCINILDAVRNLTENDPKYIAGLQAESNGSEIADIDRRRRKSQHHTPCSVEDGVLAKLLAPHLPVHAGPRNTATLGDSPISNFLRCYDYHAGDASMPHFDRSFSKHESTTDNQSRQGGRLIEFTAYSLLIYLNDDFEGGCTTFFPAESHRCVSRSARGNTSTEDIPPDSLRVAVVPRQGDVLVFPHGRHTGCYPDLLHEGSMVTAGRKTIIRTDVLYRVLPSS